MVNIQPMKNINHCQIVVAQNNLNHNIDHIYHESLRWRSLCDWTHWLYDDCTPIATGWWYTYPSEKYEFISWDDEIPNIWKNNLNVPNHQPGCDWLIWQTCYFCTENHGKEPKAMKQKRCRLSLTHDDSMLFRNVSLPLVPYFGGSPSWIDTWKDTDSKSQASSFVHLDKL